MDILLKFVRGDLFMNFMKGFILGAFIVMLSGCNAAMNLIPDRFDNVEYYAVVTLNVNAAELKTKEECTRPENILVRARVLSRYAEGTMNQTNKDIYNELDSLFTELYARENPSNVYCKMKWQNIENVTNDIVTLSGKRIKK